MQELALVTLYEFDKIARASVGDVFGGEPKRFAFQRSRYERANRPSAAEILVRVDGETRNPVRNGAKRMQVMVGKFARLAGALQIGDEIKISSSYECGLRRHETL